MLSGLVGGLLATIVMTVAMVALGDGGPPPTARSVAKIAGDDPAEYEKPGMALHFLYGIIAGAVFAVGVPLLGLSLDSLVVAAGLGLVYGLVLMVVSMLFWMRLVIGIEPEPSMMKLFGVVHAVYSLVLGTCLGTGFLT